MRTHIHIYNMRAIRTISSQKQLDRAFYGRKTAEYQ